MAFNDATLLIVGPTDPTKAARFSTTLITPGATRIVTIPDADITLGAGYTHPNHTGEVTSVGDGATTIAADAVTNAKAANMATSTIKGRITAGTGDPEDLTAAQGRTILNVADGANNYVHPNHSGDVTSVADGAQTIAADAVTYAKMQNAVGSSKLVGSGAAGAGANLEEIILGTNLSMSGTTLNAAAAAGNTGTAILDFGLHPGKSHASVVVTGQAAIVAGSIVQAWIRPVATADHTADEHLVVPIRIVAGNIVAGTGFTIHGFNSNPRSEPIVPPHSGATFYMITLTTISRRLIKAGSVLDPGGKVSRPHGQWTVAYRWS